MTYPSEIRFGDCIETMKAWLAEGKAGTVQTCVTSPPYFGLRDYGVEGQFGLEKTPDEYVKRMVEVFRLVRELLADNGTVWLNLGDSYANDAKWGGSSGGKHAAALHGNTGIGRGKKTTGLKAKDLIGIPWRVAFALQADGWWLRQDIIWNKPNCMPRPDKDRCVTSHEYVFLLSKRSTYYFDYKAIQEDAANAGTVVALGAKSFSKGQAAGVGIEPSGNGTKNTYTVPEKRNRRSVWTITTKPYKGAHFATFPRDLIEPCVLAGSSERGHCPSCGASWVREIVRTGQIDLSAKGSRFDIGKTGSRTGGDRTQPGEKYISKSTGQWLPTCSCGSDPVPDIILDPFIGSGTTAQVALKHGRRYLGCELNPEYKALVDKRIAETK